MKKLFTLLLFLCSSVAVIGQSGSISGKLTDDNNLSLPGATIKVKENTNLVTVSDSYGNFSFVGLPSGSYTLTSSFIGYSSISKSAEVTDGNATKIAFVLTPGVELDDAVIVLGDRLKGQAKALNQQRTNANITNVVSSDQVGRFPDANIGDALKRIPGITMQNDQGEARDIIIRGMAPQLNSVTLNGERIPSAEGNNRRVQMDLIPSDMIQTIQVNKAVLPSMDADAIGGSVNLVTRKAPNDLRVSGTLGSGVNLLTDKPIYTGAFVLGNRILHNKLGFVVSGSYNNQQLGSHNIEGVWIDTDKGAVLDEFDIRNYSVQRVRRSVSANLDYDFSPNHSIGFSAMYNWRDDWENRFRMRVSKLQDAFDGGKVIDLGDGKYSALGRVEYQTKGGINNSRNKNTRLEDQRVYNYTLNGNHLFNKLRATWNVTLAKASEERPNERYISFRQSKRQVDLDVSNPKFPSAYLSNRPDNLTIGLNEITEQFQYTSDEDLNARLDFSYPYSDKGMLKFGGRYRSKDKLRNNSFVEYEPLNGDAKNIGSVANKDFSNPDYLAGSQYQIGSFVTPEYLGNLDLKNPSLFKATDLPEEYAPSNYSAFEQISGGYAMIDQQLTPKLVAILGVRYEYTNIDYTGNIYNLDDETITSDSRTNSYGNFLPGIHLKYDANENTILRFAWTNTLARPNYFDLVPYAQFSPQDAELRRGNPNLVASTAMNFDLMGERYFKSIGLVSAGAFFKNIDNFIYQQTIQNYSDPQFGNDLQYTLPRNGGTARVFGLETAYQRQIWKGLGIYLNYTFTKSTTDGIEGRSENEEISLPGTAEHMFNASLSYETKKLVTRISLNYSSDYVDELGGNSFEDRYYDRQMFLDANASYAFTPQLRLFAEANNLTNQPLRYYQGIRARTQQVEYYNARFNFGLKFDLNK